ncbi:hypothetical protein MAR_021412, partial [Mya arenaria]
PAEVDRFNIFPKVVHENESFTLECNFQGHPDPTWSIFNRDNNEGSPRPQWAQIYLEEGEKGKPAKLEMNFTAYPRPHITWSREDGRPFHGQIDTWNDTTVLSWDNLNPVEVR